MQDPDRRGRRARCAALIQGCRVDHAINGHLVPATDANGDAFTYTLAKPVKIESPAVCWQTAGLWMPTRAAPNRCSRCSQFQCSVLDRRRASIWSISVSVISTTANSSSITISNSRRSSQSAPTIVSEVSFRRNIDRC